MYEGVRAPVYECATVTGWVSYYRCLARQTVTPALSYRGEHTTPTGHLATCFLGLTCTMLVGVVLLAGLGLGSGSFGSSRRFGGGHSSHWGGRQAALEARAAGGGHGWTFGSLVSRS